MQHARSSLTTNTLQLSFFCFLTATAHDGGVSSYAAATGAKWEKAMWKLALPAVMERRAVAYPTCIARASKPVNVQPHSIASFLGS